MIVNYWNLIYPRVDLLGPRFRELEVQAWSISPSSEKHFRSKRWQDVSRWGRYRTSNGPKSVTLILRMPTDVEIKTTPIEVLEPKLAEAEAHRQKMWHDLMEGVEG